MGFSRKASRDEVKFWLGFEGLVRTCQLGKGKQRTLGKDSKGVVYGQGIEFRTKQYFGEWHEVLCG